MALNLAREHEVLAYDQRPGVIAPSGSIRQVDALEELAPCGCIFLSLPSNAVVESVLFGEPSLVRHVAKGTLVADTGTSGYEPTLGAARRLEEAGLRFVDAPVSGMEAPALDGTPP